MNNCIGIDISKNTFDVHCLADGSDHHIDYTEKNIRDTVRHFVSAKPELIVMEATGGYEIPLAEELFAAGLPVAIVNPKRIRDFAKAIGQTAKTDRIDARVIARFGATLQPPATDAPDKNVVRIRVLTARKRQLKKMRTAEKNRTEHSRDEFTAQSLQTVINTLNAQIAAVDEQVRTLIPASPELKQKAEIIQSFPGIGEKTAAALVTDMPELGTLSRRQAAALTGTAPINRDSGQFRGKRMTGGGRCEVRTMLYMPTLAAIRHNPVIRSYYNRLVSGGKEKMVAVVACMRKIIVIINCMAAKNESWNPNFA
ncbi:transposase [Desulfonema ishimotonii]|uniref:Transposase n=1 Tax=Desulfonema ishimotonii TaxID=45657 RepID=A0A401FQW4_9BACT|nr:IS110 family transposase [Desulfonema ishimotonii]GBC59350.1 transposase [Desulfonema ishimotonii]